MISPSVIADLVSQVRTTRRGFLPWFALFLQYQTLFSYVRSKDKNSLNRTKNP